MILCGWCGKRTANVDRCTSCGHVDPEKPWDHRGEPVPTVRLAPIGRPPTEARDARRRVSEARNALGPDATNEDLAEHLGVSLRTLGRWQKLSG